MADIGKMWFEMGVRDEVTDTLKKVATAAAAVGNSIDDSVKNLRGMYDNAARLEQIYDKIAVARQRISEAEKKTTDSGELKRLGELKTKINEMETAFKQLEKVETLMGESGRVALEQLKQGFQLAMQQVVRYTGAIDEAARADERATKEGSRRADTLKQKWYDLTNIINRLSDAVLKAPSWSNTSGATSILDQLRSQREGVESLMNSGSKIPDNYFGADYRELIRLAREYAKTVEHDITEAHRRATSSRRASSRANVQAINDEKNAVVDYLYTEKRKDDVLAGEQWAHTSTAKAVREHGNAHMKLVAAYKQVQKESQNTSRLMQQLTNQFNNYVSLYAAERLLKSVITIGGQFEMQHVALQNILGDAQEATTLFTQLQGLAVESPKTFMELVSYSKQLSAYQIPANELYDTTKRLADMSAGLGVDMNRLILAYGQVRSAAVLRGQELRQFTEAGIPMVQALADKFTQMNGKLTTTAYDFELISKLAVPFEMVKEVLWDMTDQGGQFFNMQMELADTVYGKWQKLQDSWEIMLGRIAEGSNISGKALKWLIESAVTLVNTFDKITPMLGFFAAGKIANGGISKLASLITYNKDNAAIENMKLAKEREATRLVKERVEHGRKLSIAELRLVATRNVLRSEDLMILAAEKQISDRKLVQLYRDGEINKAHFERLMLMRQYTKEQIAQIAASGKLNLEQLLGGAAGMKGFWGKVGGGVMGFLGGWPGVIMSAVGLLLSVKGVLEADAEELAQKGEAMMSNAQQEANSLAKTLESIEADGSMEKNIEVLEDALVQLGGTGESIVAKSREHMDDINLRWQILKSGAEDYQKTLATLGGEEGKALFEKAINDSDIEKYLKKYDDAMNEMFKTRGTIERFSETYKRAISAIVGENEELKKSLSGKNLFEQIEAIGQQKLYNELFVNRNNKYGGLSSEAISALNMYFNKLVSVKKKWDEISEESVPKMEAALKALAESRGITDFSNLTPQQRQSLETMMREVVKALKTGGTEGKNKLAEELASQVFHIKIVGDLTIDKTKLSGFANYVWNRFGAGGALGEKGSIRIGKSVYTKAQVSNIFGDIDEYDENSRKDLKKLRGTLARQKQLKDGAELVAQTQAEIDKILSERKALNLSNHEEDSGGSKKDTALEGAKTQLDEVKKFYAEYKKYKEQYGREKALDIVSSLFPTISRKEAEDIIENYRGVLGKIASDLGRGTEARKKFGLSVDKMIADINLDEAKERASKAVSEIQEYISKQTGRWNLYQTLLEKTGSKEFAANAFADGQVWDAQARQLKEKLEGVIAAAQPQRTEPFEIDWSMSDAAAKEHFKGINGGYELWKQIAELIRNNYTKRLSDSASALDKMMTIEEKILRTEQEIAELRSKGAGANDPRVIQKEMDKKKLQSEQFEQSEPYLKFYSSILAMTAEEAEAAGASIKENLVKQLADGTINADKYLKSIKNVDQQLEKIRNSHGTLMTFATGGISGLLDKRIGKREAQASVAAIDVESKEKAVLEARLDINKAEEWLAKAQKEGNFMQQAAAQKAKEAAEERLRLATQEKNLAQERLERQQKLLGIDEETKKSLNDVLAVMEMISGAIDGLGQAAQQLSDMFDALGHEGSANTWSDISGYIGAIGSPVKSATNVVKSALSGDIGGMISNTVGIFTSPITQLAQLHDKKLDRTIQRSQREVKKLQNLYQNMVSEIERRLGGIYGGNEYNDMLNNYKQQLSELEKQRDAEDSKKKTDKDKLADYDQQIKEMRDTIKYYAEDMAKSIYNIDVKSWAKDLTDAVVDAWAKGEDSAEAFHDKVKDIVKDLTKNILTQKIMEKALEPVLESITSEITAKNGKLDEGSIERFARELDEKGGQAVENIVAILERLKSKGWDLSEEGSSESSSSSSIKSITEDTADLLASYINAIRADVSVNRITLSQILAIVQGQVQIPAIAQAQLQQLTLIAENTSRNASLVDSINDKLNRVIDVDKVRIK